MTTHRSSRRTGGLAACIAAVAVVATGLSGCATASTPATELTREKSPLFAILGPLSGPTGDDGRRELERKVENLIAKCMTDQGFEYTPTDNSAAAPAEDDGESRESEDWISKNGYGITLGEKDGAAADPNEDYVASLSDTQQAAYYEALHGSVAETEEGATNASKPFDPKTAGCWNTAYREANGGKGDFWEDKKYAQLLESMSELTTKAEKQPAVKAATATWASCMADAGFSTMKKKSDALELASQKHGDLYNATDGEVNSAESVDPSKADLAKFREWEIDIALADFRCDKKSDLTQVALKAQFELEEKFIADHREELDQLVDAYGNRK
ncbi:hypothetical protein [Cryocola sp. 340MFSha3.1]|uniref:hypothetical protein n=1 Tax=Cryocola sp. 340MFSha3.1 TaxID=1169145 RepID=UPI000368A9CE|nr:hypothetical protein [Cryocola sp. 340MFSha3.1]